LFFSFRFSFFFAHFVRQYYLILFLIFGHIPSNNVYKQRKKKTLDIIIKHILVNQAAFALFIEKEQALLWNKMVCSEKFPNGE